MITQEEEVDTLLGNSEINLEKHEVQLELFPDVNHFSAAGDENTKEKYVDVQLKKPAEVRVVRCEVQLEPLPNVYCSSSQCLLLIPLSWYMRDPKILIKTSCKRTLEKVGYSTMRYHWSLLLTSPQ